MQVIHDISIWREIRRKLEGKKIGFVPTMGALHVGHASLLSRSIQENEITALSIFVNPAQFNNPEDYQNYPSTLEKDLEIAEKLKIEYVLLPDEKQIYPEGNRLYFENDLPLAKILEGEFRPGHFNGMLTVVMKLLLLVRPDKAYFGEKDYQQYELIKALAENYFLETEIIPCETHRESSGLAYSSRNLRLSTSERKIADDFANVFLNAEPEKIRAALEALPLTLEYLETHQNRLFVAVKIGDVRLIDNRVIMPVSVTPSRFKEQK